MKSHVRGDRIDRVRPIMISDIGHIGINPRYRRSDGNYPPRGTDSGSETASACGRGGGSVVGICGQMRTQHFGIRTPLESMPSALGQTRSRQAATSKIA